MECYLDLEQHNKVQVRTITSRNCVHQMINFSRRIKLQQSR